MFNKHTDDLSLDLFPLSESESEEVLNGYFAHIEIQILDTNNVTENSKCWLHNVNLFQMYSVPVLIHIAFTFQCK